MKKLLLILTLMVSTTNVNAAEEHGYFNGQNLTKWAVACKEVIDICMFYENYIAGIQETLFVLNLSPDDQPLPKYFDTNRVCLRKFVTAEQMRLVVEKYVRDNPEKLDSLAVLIVIEALTQAWPCPEQ